MITTAITQTKLQEYQRLFDQYRTILKPNRKSGVEVNAYLKENYAYQVIDNVEFKEIVEYNIMMNTYAKKKIPTGKCVQIQTYRFGDVLVGIDLVSGEFCVEGENIEDVILLHDDLFVYRGLDEADVNNYVMVGEYVTLTQYKNSNTDVYVMHS